MFEARYCSSINTTTWVHVSESCLCKTCEVDVHVHVHVHIHCMCTHVPTCITQPHAHFHVYNIMCDIALSYRTRMERENQDLALEQIRLKAAEQRVTVLESIK